MTDPAPGAGDQDSQHESQDVTAASTSSPPTGSSPAQTTDDQPNPEQAERDAEPKKATGDDGQSEEDESEEGEDDEDEEEESSGSEEDEDDDEEPRLKYARLTQHLGGVYKNADATSSFLVAGDKMVIGTHNGNIVSPPYPLDRLLENG